MGKKCMKFKLFSLRRIAHLPSELFWCLGALCDNKNCHVPESITKSFPQNIVRPTESIFLEVQTLDGFGVCLPNTAVPVPVRRIHCILAHGFGACGLI